MMRSSWFITSLLCLQQIITVIAWSFLKRLYALCIRIVSRHFLQAFCFFKSNVSIHVSSPLFNVQDQSAVNVQPSIKLVPLVFRQSKQRHCKGIETRFIKPHNAAWVKFFKIFQNRSCVDTKYLFSIHKLCKMLLITKIAFGII